MDRKLSRSTLPGSVSAVVVVLAIVAARSLSEALALNVWWLIALSALLAGFGHWAASFVWSRRKS